MTDRVKRMIESLRINKYPLCIEKFRLANESLDQTAGEPMITRARNCTPIFWTTSLFSLRTTTR